MTYMPEDWATDRVGVLFEQEDGFGESSYEILHRAFAKYIQSHEQPPEPDWEAWRPALEAWAEAWGYSYPDPTRALDGVDKDRIKGLIAASKVMPK